jgi:hypothetical protein
VAHEDSAKTSSNRRSGEQLAKQNLLARTQLSGEQRHVQTAAPRPAALEVVESSWQNKILLARTQVYGEQWRGGRHRHRRDEKACMHGTRKKQW